MRRLRRSVSGGRSSRHPFYSPTSIFNRPLDARDIPDPDQTRAHRLSNQLNYGRQSGYTFQGYAGVGYGQFNFPGQIAFNVHTLSHPVWCVRSTDAKSKVGFWTNGAPRVANPDTFANNLPSFFHQVPLPDLSRCIPSLVADGSPAAAGSDASCFIWNLDTDEGWEFWELRSLATGAPADMVAALGTTWTAEYGAYLPSVSQSSGILPFNWGSRACSLGQVGGLITCQDLVDVYGGGRINHAIAFASQSNDTTFVAPATRGDGNTGGNPVATIPNGFPGAGGANPAFHQDGIPEGLRCRFPAGVDLSAAAAYPLALAVGEAIRDYGMINTDTSGNFTFYMEDPRTIGSPYQYGGPALKSGQSDLDWSVKQPNSGGTVFPQNQSNGQSVFNLLPWDQLQALQPIPA